MAATSVPAPHGIYPLTVLDAMYETLSVAMGWFVEGVLDFDLLSAALNRLFIKWPLLAGRLELAPNNPKNKYQIRFPVGTYPEGYNPYALTSTVSTARISDFFTLPLPVVSVSPPNSLFVHESTPLHSGGWISRQHPLICWHVTLFPHKGAEYTCIGVTFPHGLLDGMGISFVLHALEAEMLGREWEVPAPLYKGPNVNLLQESLDVALNDSLRVDEPKTHKALVAYKGVTPFTLWAALLFVFWHIWQHLWHGVRHEVIILPSKACTSLVGRTRKQADAEGLSDIRLSTGDVLAAWLFKTTYSDGTPYSKIVNCSNLATARPFFPETLKRYPHNSFLPIPHPHMSVGELQSIPLHYLAYTFARARESLSLDHTVSLYNTCLNALKSKYIVAMIPVNGDAQEDLTISNLSIARISDMDWTGIGGKATLCCYRSTLTNGPVSGVNFLAISGRTPDGGTILDLILNKKRLAQLEAGVHQLIEDSN